MAGDWIHRPQPRALQSSGGVHVDPWQRLALAVLINAIKVYHRTQDQQVMDFLLQDESCFHTLAEVSAERIAAGLKRPGRRHIGLLHHHRTKRHPINK